MSFFDFVGAVVFFAFESLLHLVHVCAFVLCFGLVLSFDVCKLVTEADGPVQKLLMHKNKSEFYFSTNQMYSLIGPL